MTPSHVGKTVLRGHGLRHEGTQRYSSSGEPLSYWRWATNEACGKCSCGELSPAGVSKAAVQRWHREHKDNIRAANAKGDTR